MNNHSALIFDTKPYSINDGPGIRITIFLKGCPLSCAWCHNPEGISPRVQKLYSKAKCIGCGTCVENCPKGALTLTSEGIKTDTYTCDLCGICADVCPAKATEMSGKPVTVEEVMKVIRRETVMMDQSEGGVTISGGEPMMQSDFLIELLDACGKEGIHRAVDTAGLSKTETLLEVAKRTDLFLYDLKMMDPERHKKFTGVTNDKILENLKILADTGANINIRIPLIKGVNADNGNIRQSAEFVASLPGEKKLVSLLPYHNVAIHKYDKLGQEYNNGEMEEPAVGDIEMAIRIFGEYGLIAAVGG
ncbi:MAG: glycyl-radical enzyme activating protein [Porphyromonadaceae bacterium]|nr:MAG: glycyl-radical enzyme activating protein [Porphyromonadaceae bacterium]